MRKCIMAVMAHADDLEVYAGGTMAKFTDRGYEGILVMLTANIAGASALGKSYRKTRPEEVMPIRAEETRRAAEILGVKTIREMRFKDNLYSNGHDFVFLGDPEYDIFHPCGNEPLAAAAINPRCIDRLKEVIRTYEPEIVITHNFGSSFPHTCSAHLTNQAFGLALKEGADLGQLWIPAHVRYCAWESDVRLYPSPNILIDIDATWERKEKAMLAHRSQNLEGAVEKVKLVNQYWGIARQCGLAEPFFSIHDGRYR